MDARYLLAAAALTACASHGPQLPEAVAIQVGHGESEPRVLWVVPGPDAWVGPVMPREIPGLERAFRTRLGRVVGVARVVRWVEGGALQASGFGGPLIRIDAPWVLAIRVDGWGLRKGDTAVETFLELELTLRDDRGDQVWQRRVACDETLLPAGQLGAAELARAVVSLENDHLQRSYSVLASTCGARAWAALTASEGRRRAPEKIGSPGR